LTLRSHTLHPYHDDNYHTATSYATDGGRDGSTLATLATARGILLLRTDVPYQPILVLHYDLFLPSSLDAATTMKKTTTTDGIGGTCDQCSHIYSNGPVASAAPLVQLPRGHKREKHNDASHTHLLMTTFRDRIDIWDVMVCNRKMRPSLQF